MDEIGKDLLGKLGVMFSESMAHMQKHGVSKEYQNKIKEAHSQLRKLISDYDTNLADCTEAIDALIEERDALIEDNKAYDERIDKILEHYERLDSEPLGEQGTINNPGQPEKKEYTDPKTWCDHLENSEPSGVDEGLLELLNEAEITYLYEESHSDSMEGYDKAVEGFERIRKLLQSQRGGR